MIRNIITTILIICTLICLSSCSYNTSNYTSVDIFAMDTFVNVVYEASDNNSIKSFCKNELDHLENIFSKTIETSEISLINKNVKFEISNECAEVLEKSLEIANNTNGAFNPAMGQIVNLWDITGKKYIPTDDEIFQVLPYCSHISIDIFSNIVTKEFSETQLDLGACVKGYAAQNVINLLKKKNIQNAMVSIGGNIAVTGHAPGRNDIWRVGIRNPFNPDTIAGYIDCTDSVISVSGDYERYFEKDGIIYHHIFDSKTGKPSDTDIKSVAVIATDGLVSDALSTALFCMGSEKTLNFYRKKIYVFEAIIFKDDGTIIATDGIKDKFKLSEEYIKLP